MVITGANKADDAREGGILGLVIKKCFKIELKTRNYDFGQPGGKVLGES